MTEMVFTYIQAQIFRHYHHGISMACQRCRTLIQIGDVIERKSANGKSKYYHVKCYEEMLI